MFFSNLFKAFLLLLLFFGACQTKKSKSKFSDFSETESGLFYHRHNIGEGKNYPKNNDFLILRLVFKTMDDSVLPISLFKNENGYDTLHYLSSQTKFMLYEAIGLLAEGDSCTFIVNTHLFVDTAAYTGIFASFNNDSAIKLEAKLILMKTEEQQANEKAAYEKMCHELVEQEQKELQLFLDTTHQPFPKTPDENGIYFVLTKKGNGKAVKLGDNLIIRYIGKQLNGDTFDVSTYEKEALSFRLGEPGQVVRGIELALYKMHEGDRANILLPSSLAFGSKGSAEAIVSPFKTITFALEILKIN